MNVAISASSLKKQTEAAILPLFGRQDLSDVFYKTKEIIFNKQLFKIC